MIPVPGKDKLEQVLGAYLQQTWTPAPWLALNAGARVDAQRSVRSRGIASLRRQLGRVARGTLKLIYAEAFRAPSWNEAQSSNVNLLAADDLRPGTRPFGRKSLEQKLGAQRVLFGVFRSWWTDLIDLHRITRGGVRPLLSAEGKLPSLLSFSAQQYRNISPSTTWGSTHASKGASARARCATA